MYYKQTIFYFNLSNKATFRIRLKLLKLHILIYSAYRKVGFRFCTFDIYISNAANQVSISNTKNLYKIPCKMKYFHSNENNINMDNTRAVSVNNKQVEFASSLGKVIKVCWWLATGRWFSLCTPVSSQ